MKLSLVSLFVLLFLTTHANNYYLSSVSGDDKYTPQQAGNPSTPWKSIDRINQFSGNLLPGDSILFRRDEIFFGSLTISLIGNSSRPIVVSAYGSGAKPIITGLQDVIAWSSLGGNIFENTCSNCTANLNTVTVQDTLQPIGRWPKLTDAGEGYLIIESHTDTSSITSASLSSAPNFVGGELVSRARGWILDRARVTSQNSNTVNYAPFTSPQHPQYTYEPLDGYGFFFQNHVNALTQNGDWMYDSTFKKFRMYFASQNPADFKVKIAAIPNLVNISYSKNIVIDGLSFRGANNNTFNIDNSSTILLNDCDIDLSGIDGVFISKTGSDNIIVNNSSITHSNNNGITANNTANCIIQNTVVQNSGMISGMGLSGDGEYIGISRVGDNSIIEYNEIKSTGYSGLEYGGDSVKIKNNFIDSFCITKSGGAGIYNLGQPGKNSGRIFSNIILNGIGDRYGRKQTSLDSQISGNVQGIFMDFGDGALIANNSIANCSFSGLELSDAINIQVLNNTFYNNTTAGIFYFQSKRNISNLTLKYNIAFATKSEQLISLVGPDKDIERSWGVLDSNYYSRPVSEPNNIDTIGFSHQPSLVDFPDGGIIEAANGRFYSLDRWKILSGQDAHSVKTPADSLIITDIEFKYNASKFPKTYILNGLYTDVKKDIFDNTITLAPYTSVILIKKKGNINFAKGLLTIYPNPIQNSATISINPEVSESATLNIYDLQGRMVKNLFSGMLESGQPKTFILNKGNLTNGLYIVRLTSKSMIISRKIIINR